MLTNKTCGMALKGSCLHAIIPHYTIPPVVSSHSSKWTMQQFLALHNLLDRTIFIKVNVEPLGLYVHGLHIAGLENAVLLGQVCLGEGLGVALGQPTDLD